MKYYITLFQILIYIIIIIDQCTSETIWRIPYRYVDNGRSTLAGQWLNPEDASCFQPVVSAACFLDRLQLSDTLHVSDLRFHLPDTIIVLAINVIWEVSVGQYINPSCKEYSLSVFKVNDLGSIEQHTIFPKFSETPGWSKNRTIIKYPKIQDQSINMLWNTTWTAEDLNNPEFGASIRLINDIHDAIAFVHCVNITVEYENIIDTTPTTDDGYDIINNNIFGMKFWDILSLFSILVVFCILYCFISLPLVINMRKNRKKNSTKYKHILPPPPDTFESGVEDIYIKGKLTIKYKIRTCKNYVSYIGELENKTPVLCNLLLDKKHNRDELEKQSFILKNLYHPNILELYGLYSPISILRFYQV